MPPADRHVVVLGGSRFLGKAVVEQLLHHGFRVTTVNRGRSPVRYSAPVERVRADRRRSGEYLSTLRRLSAPFVVDTSAYRRSDVEPVVDAFGGRVVRAVHVSSLSVYRAPYPEPIREEWPLETDPRHGYGFHKAECERFLMRHDPSRFPWTILRLPALYGPWDLVGRELFFHGRLVDDRPVVLPRWRSHRYQNVYVDDAARVCAGLLSAAGAAGGAFNLGGRPFTLAEWTGRIAAAAGREPHVVELPLDELDRCGYPCHRIPYWLRSGSAVLDTARLRRVLGSVPTVAAEDGLRLTFTHRHPHLQPAPVHRIPYSLDDRLLGAPVSADARASAAAVAAVSGWASPSLPRRTARARR